MKLLILGHARHGKDTAAEYWRERFGLSFKSSSLAASEIFIYDTLKDKYNYQNPEECFEDRVNHRKEWYDLIVAYNDGQCRLTKDILRTNDCYVGMRSLKEYLLSQHLFDLVIWIDASGRLPKEPVASMTIPMKVADIVIPNNGIEEVFLRKLQRIGEQIWSDKIKYNKIIALDDKFGDRVE